MEYLFLYIILGLLLLACFVFGVFILREIFQLLFSYGVPFVKTPDHKIQKLLTHMKLNSGDKFLDVGCGDGKIMQAVEEKFTDITVSGIENSPRPYKLALIRKQQHGLKYTLYKQDFFDHNFREYNVIYSYTLPYLMKGIWEKMQKECQPGTLLYSSSFQVPDVEAIDVIKIKENNHIYVYRVT